MSACQWHCCSSCSGTCAFVVRSDNAFMHAVEGHPFTLNQNETTRVSHCRFGPSFGQLRLSVFGPHSR